MRGTQAGTSRGVYRRKGSLPPVLDVSEIDTYSLNAELTGFPLFDLAPPFDGPDLEPEDQRRLGKQLQAVLALMKDGQSRTLREIAAVVGCEPQSASARLRDLRKSRWGSHQVERAKVGVGVFQYRLVLPKE